MMKTALTSKKNFKRVATDCEIKELEVDGFRVSLDPARFTAVDEYVRALPDDPGHPCYKLANDQAIRDLDLLTKGGLGDVMADVELEDPNGKGTMMAASALIMAAPGLPSFTPTPGQWLVFFLIMLGIMTFLMIMAWSRGFNKGTKVQKIVVNFERDPQAFVAPDVEELFHKLIPDPNVWKDGDQYVHEFQLDHNDDHVNCPCILHYDQNWELKEVTVHEDPECTCQDVPWGEYITRAVCLNCWNKGKR